LLSETNKENSYLLKKPKIEVGLFLPVAWIEGKRRRLSFSSLNIFSFEQAAIRETLEEAGIHITLKGILRIDHSIFGGIARLGQEREFFFFFSYFLFQCNISHQTRLNMILRFL